MTACVFWRVAHKYQGPSTPYCLDPGSRGGTWRLGVCLLQSNQNPPPGKTLVCLSGVKWHLGTLSHRLSFLQNPVHVLNHIGVNPGPFPLTAAFSPAGDAHQVPDVVVFTGQGAPRVSLWWGEGRKKKVHGLVQMLLVLNAWVSEWFHLKFCSWPFDKLHCKQNKLTVVPCSGNHLRRLLLKCIKHSHVNIFNGRKHSYLTSILPSFSVACTEHLIGYFVPSVSCLALFGCHQGYVGFLESILYFVWKKFLVCDWNNHIYNINTYV